MGSLHSNPTGAPTDGRTGSPGDGGKTCATAGCHNGPASSVSNIITSDIPAEGYTPGASYTITVTVDGGGSKGLCVSPQKEDGTLMGTLTAGAGTAFVGGKYITHTSPKVAAPAVWTFTWTAPAAGSGRVVFYGAFANNRTTTRKTEYAVEEKIASGIKENSEFAQVTVFPNPASQQGLITIGFAPKNAGNVKVTLLDITGKEISVLTNEFLSSVYQEQSYNLPVLNKGIYFIRISGSKESLTRKLFIQ
ncbi:MAG: T9SS type A sorting domain-containing protein [Bacteroidia bacterium]|nr:T9SS type A sorting domain-containing protein [Bacteroidia bacterium]